MVTHTYIDSLRQLDITLTPEQHIAFALLDSRGFRFLVHFGVANAIEKADELCDFELVH